MICDWWIQFECFFVSRFIACDRNCDSLTAAKNAIVKVAFELRSWRVFEKNSMPDKGYFSQWHRQLRAQNLSTAKRNKSYDFLVISTYSTYNHEIKCMRQYFFTILIFPLPVYSTHNSGTWKYSSGCNFFAFSTCFNNCSRKYKK